MCVRVHASRQFVSTTGGGAGGGDVRRHLTHMLRLNNERSRRRVRVVEMVGHAVGIRMILFANPSNGFRNG